MLESEADLWLVQQLHLDDCGRVGQLQEPGWMVRVHTHQLRLTR